MSGPIDLLCGMAALAPDGFESAAGAYGAHLEGMFTHEPISFRSQNGGDYDEKIRLKPGIVDGKDGFSIHRVD